MKRQLKMLGFHNWDLKIQPVMKIIQTPAELFIDFYNKGLVSRKETYVNWDPIEQIVLANEQVINEEAEIKRNSRKKNYPSGFSILLNT